MGKILLSYTDPVLNGFRAELEDVSGLSEEERYTITNLLVQRTIAMALNKFLPISISFMKNHRLYVEKETKEEVYAGKMSLANFRATGGDFDSSSYVSSENERPGYVFLKTDAIRGRNNWLDEEEFNSKYVEKESSEADRILAYLAA